MVITTVLLSQWQSHHTRFAKSYKMTGRRQEKRR